MKVYPTEIPVRRYRFGRCSGGEDGLRSTVAGKVRHNLSKCLRRLRWRMIETLRLIMPMHEGGQTV